MFGKEIVVDYHREILLNIHWVRIESDLPIEEFQHFCLLDLRQLLDIVFLRVVEDDVQKLFRSHRDSCDSFGVDHLEGLVDDYAVDETDMFMVGWVIVLDEGENTSFPDV